MALSPYETVREGRWRAALFTTYSLSLSFFEAYLLRNGLRRSNCSEIWVVADLDGYRDSLLERQSRLIGHAYRLAPVALDRGVFHPKIGYLVGDTFDVLWVGSGNLTYGGFGRNVEVFETFRSDKHPGVFSQFDAFLAEVSGRGDFHNPNDEWLARFRGLASSAGKRLPPAEGADELSLIHCASSPVADQLVKEAAKRGGATHLRVLSPFFDPDAAGIKSLQTRLACDLTVAVLPGQESRSGFPFGSEKVAQPKCAVIELERPKRRLHAKWLEIDCADGSRMTLTGSVNATRQSLCTADNIEVGVLRVEKPAPRRLTWKRIAVPSDYTKFQFRAAGLGARVLLHARLSTDCRISGKLVAAAPEGPWRAQLVSADGPVISTDLQVSADGSFEMKAAAPNIERAVALQLSVSRGTQAGRCWVENELLLEVTQIGGASSPLLALFRGDASDEDDSAFLAFFSEGIAEYAPELAAIQRQHSDAPRNTAVGSEKNYVVSVSALATSDYAIESVPLHGPGASRLSALLNRLLRRFEETDSREEQAVETFEHDDVETADEAATADEETAQRRAARPLTIKSLAKFRERVRGYVEESEIPPDARAVALNVWLTVEMKMRLRAADAKDEARRFAREWILAASRSGLGRTGGELLTRNVVLIAAGLGSSSTPEELVGLHEALETFFRGKIPDATYVSGVRIPSLFQPLMEGGIQDGLARVVAAQTRRGEIQIIRSVHVARGNLPQGLSLLQTSEGRQLKEDMVSRRSVRLMELPADRSSCPHCKMVIRPPALLVLRRQRLGKCVNCETYLFDEES